MNTRGVTLLEAVISLGLFAVLSLGVFSIWFHTTNTSANLREQQVAFENARVAMDALIMNMQLAQEITLQTDSNNTLRQLTLLQRNRDNPCLELRNLYGLYPFRRHRFYFDVHAPYGAAKHHRLEFGTNNEFAANLANIQIWHDSGIMHITITTGCDYPLTLHGAADVRFKQIIFA